MIHLQRPDAIPAILQQQGKQRTKTHCGHYLANPTKYQNGSSKFSFDNRIYGDESVRSALIDFHLGKCCYCERSIGHSGDVEHFRPKGEVCQDLRTETLTPGYYWLAYEWSNLLYSCKECNQLYKRSYFPLVDPAKRVRSHSLDTNLSAESPLLIDPAQNEPNRFIGFHEEIAYAIDANEQAGTTIRVCGLNRSDLKLKRRERLESIRVIHALLLLAERGELEPEDVELVDRAKQSIAFSLSNAGEFCSMIRESFSEEGVTKEMN